MANTLHLAEEITRCAEDFAKYEAEIFIGGAEFKRGIVKGLQTALLILDRSRRGGTIPSGIIERMTDAVTKASTQEEK